MPVCRVLPAMRMRSTQATLKHCTPFPNRVLDIGLTKWGAVRWQAYDNARRLLTEHEAELHALAQVPCL